MTVEEFHAALKAQGSTRRELLVFICPMCETPQTGAELIAVGAGADFDEVEKYLAFSCIGRWTAQTLTKASKARKRGCDWTLGGFLKAHKLEVITPEGSRHPRFEPATAEVARAHLLAKGLIATSV